MYTFQSSLFDSQQFNDNSVYGGLDPADDHLLKKDLLNRSDSDFSRSSGDNLPRERRLNAPSISSKEQRGKGGDARGKTHNQGLGQATEDCLKEKKKAVEVPQHIAQVEWFLKMRQEREQHGGGSVQSSEERQVEKSANNVSGHGADTTDIGSIKSRGNGFKSVNMQPIMESIGEEDQLEAR